MKQVPETLSRDQIMNIARKLYSSVHNGADLRKAPMKQKSAWCRKARAAHRAVLEAVS